MPSIGFGSNKKTRHVLPCGYKKFLVHNEKDLETLLMNAKTCVFFLPMRGDDFHARLT